MLKFFLLILHHTLMNNDLAKWLNSSKTTRSNFDFDP